MEKDKIKGLIDEDCREKCWQSRDYSPCDVRMSIAEPDHRNTPDCWMCHRHDALAQAIVDTEGK